MASFAERELVRARECKAVPRLVAVKVLQVIHVGVELVQSCGLSLLMDVDVLSEEVPSPAEGLLRLDLDRVVPFRGAEVPDFPQSAIVRILRQQGTVRNGLLVA